MAGRDLKSIYSELVEYFSPRPEPADSHHLLWMEEMQKYRIDDVIGMLDHFKKNSLFFPSINECVALADSMAYNRRQREHQARKKEERSGRREPKDDYGKQRMALWDDIAMNKLTRREILERCKALGISTTGQLSPGKLNLSDYYAKWNDDLDRKPGGSVFKKEAVSV